MTGRQRQTGTIPRPRRRNSSTSIGRDAEARRRDFLDLRTRIGLKNTELAQAIGRSASTMAHYASTGEDGRDVPEDVLDDMREHRRRQALDQLERLVDELIDYGEDIEITRRH